MITLGPLIYYFGSLFLIIKFVVVVEFVSPVLVARRTNLVTM